MSFNFTWCVKVLALVYSLLYIYCTFYCLMKNVRMQQITKQHDNALHRFIRSTRPCMRVLCPAFVQDKAGEFFLHSSMMHQTSELYFEMIFVNLMHTRKPI